VFHVRWAELVLSATLAQVEERSSMYQLAVSHVAQLDLQPVITLNLHLPIGMAEQILHVHGRSRHLSITQIQL
jgi:hypothetical protein